MIFGLDMTNGSHFDLVVAPFFLLAIVVCARVLARRYPDE